MNLGALDLLPGQQEGTGRHQLPPTPLSKAIFHRQGFDSQCVKGACILHHKLPSPQVTSLGFHQAAEH